MENAKALNNCITNSEFKIISNSAHEVNIDNPLLTITKISKRII